jgi:hypothetical protein
MSRCQLIEFRNSKPANAFEFSNSWGGAARIWSALFDRYLKDPRKEYDSWLSRAVGSDRSLWDLAKREDLPLFERAVHASTFDRAIVKRENFALLAQHLREFASKYPPQGVCHLNAWADRIEASHAEAIGFYGTSVSENLWYDWDEEKDESVPYDLASRDEHFEVYEFLADSTVAAESAS